MVGFNRDNKRSGGNFKRSFGGKRDGGGSRPTMHDAVCSDCGDDCQIPFRPTGGRPVFCSNCFEKQDNGGNSRPNKFSDDRRSSRPRFEDKQMHDAVCSKCGDDCQIPFKPMNSKPIYCDNCFDKTATRGKGGQDSGEVVEQLKKLNYKLDQLVNALVPKSAIKKVEKPAEVKKENKPEIKKEKKVHPVKSSKAGLSKTEFNRAKKTTKKAVAKPKKKVAKKKAVAKKKKK